MDELTEILPESIPITPNKIKRPYPNLLGLGELVLIAIGFMFILAIPYAIVLSFFKSSHIKSTPTLKSLGNMVAYIALVGSITWFAAWKQKRNDVGGIEDIRYKFSYKSGLFVALSTVTALIITERASAWIPYSKSYIKMIEDMVTDNIFSLINLIIIAPIMEEILCRGIILKGLLKNYHPAIAIFISALFFGFIHLNIWQGIHAFLIGLYLGWLYYRFKSVVPAIICHMVVNSLSYLFMFFPADKNDFFSLLGFRGYVIAVIASVIIFSAVCRSLYKATKIKNYGPVAF